MATHSSINAWRIPWTQEPGRLSPWGHRGRHDLETNNNKYQRLMNFLSQMKIIKKKQFVKRIKTREFLLALGRRLQDLCFWFFLTLSPMTAALEAAQGSLTLWPMTKKKSSATPTEHCCCSVATSCLTLCDPMDCSTPRQASLSYLPEFAQTHVHRVSEAIQSSHPLSPTSPPAFSFSQHQDLFQWVSSSHQVVKVLDLQLQHQSIQWIFGVDFL